MQLRMSPGGRMRFSRRKRPELPPSSVTVTMAARSAMGRSVLACSSTRRMTSSLGPRFFMMISGTEEAASFHGKEFNTEGAEYAENTEKKQHGSEDPPLQNTERSTSWRGRLFRDRAVR